MCLNLKYLLQDFGGRSVKANLHVGSLPLIIHFDGNAAVTFWPVYPAVVLFNVSAKSSVASDTSHSQRRDNGEMSSYFQFGSLAIFVSLGTGNCPHTQSHCVGIHN